MPALTTRLLAHLTRRRLDAQQFPQAELWASLTAFPKAHWSSAGLNFPQGLFSQLTDRSALSG
ncbi:hypothetical protein [Deinococcus sonorensis]|uniref:Uncharacterized protein n=1 Tax=Deinococcus sonorensis TaxID=309891 RepID=A0ABV8Y823_9DEIO